MRATWLAIALIEARGSLEQLVPEVETALTAASQTTLPETVLRAVLASVERVRVRAREVITAIDAANQATSREIARTLLLKEPRVEEAAIASVAASSVTWPETALTLRPAPTEDLQDKATASNAVSPAI